MSGEVISVFSLPQYSIYMNYCCSRRCCPFYKSNDKENTVIIYPIYV